MSLRFLVIATLLVGCGQDPRRADWQVRFADPDLAERAAAVEVIVLAGGCDGDVVDTQEVRRGEEGRRPERLAPGRYGFAARARDGDCRWFAAGCVEVELPTDEDVIVGVGASEEIAACEPEACVDGVCAGEGDAGPLGDAGPEVDGGGDAGPPEGEDAGPFDAGPPPIPDAGCVSSGAACAGDAIVECLDGVLRVVEACPLGCAPAGPACLRLRPSNVPDDVGHERGDADLVLGGPPGTAYRFDTKNGRIRNETTGEELRNSNRGGVSAGIYFDEYDTDAREDVKIGVWVMRSLRVEAGVEVYFVADNAAVVIAEETVIVDGLVSADAQTPYGEGAAADRVTLGRGAGGADRQGGAGGSYGTQGAAGGGDGAGTPAELYGNPELVPLWPGSPGSSGGGRGGSGGRGGGALQISAGRSIRVGATGRISVSGAGGDGGGRSSLNPTTGGGGGGGSGGGLLLEAPEVVLDGRVAANGGGGGAGTGVGPGDPGQPGGPERVPAPGGVGSTPGGGGGAGSDAGGVAAEGLADSRGGGGGGGAGRIRINDADGVGAYPNVFPRVESGATTLGIAARGP